MEQQFGPLAIAPKGPAASVRRPQSAGGVVLSIIEKEQILEQRPLDQTRALTFGRTRDNDIVLPDQAISRRHFKLERHNGSWTIVDLNSTNGVLLGGERLDPFVRTTWDGDTPIKVGPYLLTLDTSIAGRAPRMVEARPAPPPAAATPPETAHVADDVDALSDSDDAPILQLEPATLRVEPDKSGTLQLTIYNRSGRLQQFDLMVSGVPQEWVSLSTTRVVVAANGAQTVQLQVRPTIQGAPVEAGEQPIALHAYTRNKQGMAGVARGKIIVAPLHRFQLQVDESRHGTGVASVITITNQGNIGDVYNIRAHDEEDALNFRARHWQMMLTPGTDANRRVLIKPKRQPLVGTPKTHPYSLSVKSDSGLKETYEGLVTVRPIVSIQFVIALLAIILLGALAIWAVNAFAAGPIAAAVGSASIESTLRGLLALLR